MIKTHDRLTERDSSEQNSGPATRIFFDQRDHHTDMIRAIIQAGNIVIVLAASFDKGFAVFHIQFFKRLETVCRKRRADDVDTPDAVLSPVL